MWLQRHSVVEIAGFVGGALAVAVAETSIFAEPTKWVVALVATVVGGLVLGHAQYAVERDSASGRRPIFDAPAANVGWWALFYALVFHTPPRVATEGASSLSDLGVLPGWFVVAAFVLVTLVSLALGGVDPRVRPSYSEYTGKRDTLGEE
ncbi:hypothetical protein NDI56_13260 [Haloarcula sp. S1CR25-12]|uniref:Uncharacterized protein n=1 Tax=Haloarcula saliterrae TaxID=2950534 RepID=A0ABU2FDM8_9EURY|nr:hypothetical protein [Haloarcula sp. S1CR25-12]MDS0260366.1 hypothetical protein [Haloarcula sp. S1CR25-12]